MNDDGLRFELEKIAQAARYNRATDPATSQALSQMADGLVKALRIQDRRIVALERQAAAARKESGSTQGST